MTCTISIRALCLLALLAPASPAAESLLEGEFWMPADRLSLPDIEAPIDESLLADLLLEEARSLFSGMLYGYDFVYTPSDRRRAIQERFELIPVDQIERGDPRLQVIETRTTENRLIARIVYRPARFQSARRRAWQSSPIGIAGGRGDASYTAGLAGRTEALRNAGKNALRAYLRARIPNKPHETQGTILLDQLPRIIVDNGRYVASIRINIEIESIRPYHLF